MVAVLSLNLYQPCMAANGEKESESYSWQKVLAEEQSKQANWRKTKKKIQEQNKSESKTSFLDLLGRLVLCVAPFVMVYSLFFKGGYKSGYSAAKKKCDEMLGKNFIDKKSYDELKRERDELERNVDNLKQNNKSCRALKAECYKLLLNEPCIDKKEYDELKRERDDLERERDGLEGTVEKLEKSNNVMTGKFNSCDIDRKSCKMGWDSRVFQANSHAQDLKKELGKCYNEVNRLKRDFGTCQKPQQSSQPEESSRACSRKHTI